MFQDYYNERDSKRQRSLDTALGIVGRDFWMKLEHSAKWFDVIEHATKLVSQNDFPMSAYLPLVQALRNGFNAVLRNEGGRPFDEIFCDGARSQLVDFVRARFNMDGEDPEGRKVGLLDNYQVWAFLADPHRELLPKAVYIDPSTARCLNDMIKFFCPDKDEQAVRNIKFQFRQYYGHDGPWIDFFDQAKRLEVNDEETKAEQKKLTMTDVSEWVNKTGGHDGRLNFFVLHPKDEDLYKLILEPLLSIRSVGSITVERIAKPMKRSVLANYRAAMKEDKAEICLRVGLNLRHLMAARQQIRQEHEAQNNKNAAL